MSIRDKALEKYRTAEAEREAAEIERLEEQGEKTRMVFVKFFGEEPEAASGNEVTIEGMTIRAINSYGEWQLKGECIQCGTVGWSDGFRDVEGLGKMINSISLGNHYTCNWQPEEEEESPGERLIALVREIVRDEKMNQNEY